ncbi:MAG: sigma-70 family RNA polymerase sigma factor [Polyangiaceae bacterium]|jgi:RNA polymerase sigma-70 factor (ECF subfamily)|nr:sigma-70 family RNA polymerase sigma factor [Polyangiaceae bacterium]
MSDDATLWSAWCAGDKRAGEALFERHFDTVYRFFENKINGDVSDLVQRTFLGCIEARERFRGASSFRTFLFAIARNELYVHYRSKKKGEALDFSVSSIAELGPSPSTLARQRSEREILLAALQQLPVELQLALELHYWESIPGSELAVILEVPEGTVRSRLRRALEQLRERLAAESGGERLLGAGGDLEAWAQQLRARMS